MKYLIFLFVGICSVSCSKSKQNLNRIQNTWRCHLVKVEDGNGFIYYDTLYNSNLLECTRDSMNAHILFEYTPLGESIEVEDSLVVMNNYTIEINSLFLGGWSVEMKIKHLTHSELVLSFYDVEKYRLKTFFFNR